MFHFEDFNEYMQSEEVSKLAAQIANELIERNGYVLFGEALEDEKGETILTNFSTEKKPCDTHTILALKVAPMRTFPPLKTEVKAKVFGVTQVQVDRALKEINSKLEKEKRELTKKGPY